LDRGIVIPTRVRESAFRIRSHDSSTRPASTRLSSKSLGGAAHADHPGKLKKSFFTTSGTEADETAIMLAKIYTGQQEIIALRP